MASNNNGLPLDGAFLDSFVCTSAGTTAGVFVALTAAGTVDLNADPTVPSIGVVQSPASWDAGDTVLVCLDGPCKFKLGGAVPGTSGTYGTVMPGTGGKAVVFASGGGALQQGRVTDYHSSATTASGDLLAGVFHRV